MNESSVETTRIVRELKRVLKAPGNDVLAARAPHRLPRAHRGERERPKK